MHMHMTNKQGRYFDMCGTEEPNSTQITADWDTAQQCTPGWQAQNGFNASLIMSARNPGMKQENEALYGLPRVTK